MLKLILADNQAIFRAGIAKVLAVEDEMRIVAQAQTAEQMFMALDKFRAAVLVCAALLAAGSVLSAVMINSNVLRPAADQPAPEPECRVNCAVGAPPLETGRRPAETARPR